jgi:hypothetical protein
VIRRPLAKPADDIDASDVAGPSSERATLVDIELSDELREALMPGKRTSDSPATTIRRGPKAEIEAAFSAGDFERARQLAEEVLRREPNDVDAKSFAESARLRMRHVYAARLGSLLRVPWRATDEHGIKQARLGPRELAVAKRVDGYSTFEDILDDCGVDDLEALRILCDLLARGLIAAE